MNTLQNVKTTTPTVNRPSQPGFILGNTITDYFASLNANTQLNTLPNMQNNNGLRLAPMENSLVNDASQEPDIEPPTNALTDGLQTTSVEGQAEEAATATSALGPMVVASSITSGLIHANNQERDVMAQRSPNFDAQHIAGLQDARDETVGEVGMLGTAALGATLGPAGVALGALGTGIAESLDTVSSDQTISTAGSMTNAAAGT